MPDQNVQNKETKPSGGEFSKNLMSDADTEVRENENASLPDETYVFDEDNTDNEEYHDFAELDGDSSDLTDIFEGNDDLQ